MEYEIGMNIEIIHLEGDEYNKYDGRIGTITSIENGLLYGNWGLFTIDPDIDSIKCITNTKNWSGKTN